MEVARKKRRSHPFPLSKATHRIKKYERHIHNLIFLLRPERDHQFKQTGRCFLYENLLGGIDNIDDNDDEDETDDADDSTTNLRNQRDLRDLLQQTKIIKDHSDDNVNDDSARHDNDDDNHSDDTDEDE